MIPIKDLNPRRSFPIVTLLLIAVNIVVFIHQITLPPAAGEAFIKIYAPTPSHVQMALEGHRYSPLQAFLPLITCMFLHGGFLHIIGNMWFLWIFGDNVEDQFGPFGYLLFYFVCGIRLWRHAGRLLLGLPYPVAGGQRRHFGRSRRLPRLLSPRARADPCPVVGVLIAGITRLTGHPVKYG
jgi:hypothetical protein